MQERGLRSRRRVRRSPDRVRSRLAKHAVQGLLERHDVVPIAGFDCDTGPRADTSLEALAALRPVFDESGTITAGNASPVTDGASAVLLMSEERARTEGHEPLAFIRAMEYAAMDPAEGRGADGAAQRM